MNDNNIVPEEKKEEGETNVYDFETIARINRERKQKSADDRRATNESIRKNWGLRKPGTDPKKPTPSK